MTNTPPNRVRTVTGIIQALCDRLIPDYDCIFCAAKGTELWTTNNIPTEQLVSDLKLMLEEYEKQLAEEKAQQAKVVDGAPSTTEPL